MGTLVNRRRVMGGGSTAMVEIEYLESTGTQYINTGIYPNQNTSAVLDMHIINIYDWRAPWGCRDGNQVNGFYFLPLVNTTKSRWAYANRNTEAGKISVGRYLFDANKNVLKITGPTTSTYTLTYNTFSCNHSFVIFGMNNENGVSITKDLRLYYCKIYDNGVLVRDFIPVRVGTIGYLYDNVSGTLFSNAGTGNFVLGPDKT